MPAEPKNQTGDCAADVGAWRWHRADACGSRMTSGLRKIFLRMLTREGCRVTVVPAKTSAADVLAMEPDGVFFSNGPGDRSHSIMRSRM